MNLKKTIIAAATALTLAGGIAGATYVIAHEAGGMGPGMMGGYGSGPSDRTERPARDWDDMGPGMMHRGGMSGMAGGMMGGPMMDGAGMMGLGLRDLYRLELDDKQRRQVKRIDDELRRKNWDIMGKMHDEMSTLRGVMWSEGKRDRAAILAANKRMFELRQQMLENGLDAADRAEAVLTPQQREQLRRREP